MCGPKGYGVSAVLVINRVSILAILVMNRVWFLLSSLEFEFCFWRTRSFIIIIIIIDKTMFKVTVPASTVIN